MSEQDRWLLPEGIEEALPAQAERLEHYRRKLLDLFSSWGYELVIPPFIEYLESLLIGTGSELDLQTFKLIDQLSGRLMGVRADMTPQVARIDAHVLKTERPARLCYLGTVLRTRPDGLTGSRSPIQVGAELYGLGGVDGDVEVIRLMLAGLEACHIQSLSMDLGHVGIFASLAKQANLSKEQETQLFNLLQRKAVPEMEEFLNQLSIKASAREMLIALAELNGSDEVLTRARRILKAANREVHANLDYIDKVVEKLRHNTPRVDIHFDLAELRGYHYQTGVVFATFVPGQGQEISRGGRYDEIGKVFGRARPATGFSMDLKTLVQLADEPPAAKRKAILAPAVDDIQLEQAVSALRAQGERVIYALSGQNTDMTECCDRKLVQDGEDWQVVELAHG